MQTTVQEHTTPSKTQAKTKAFVAPAPVIQKKLKIGAVDDPLEAEADAMADRVVQQMDTPPVPPSNKGSLVQKKCSQCKDDELQKKPLADGISSWVQKKSLLSGRQSVASEGITNQINASQGGGSLMGDTTRSFMESSFGNDFSGVRIHTDSNAIQLSKALNAQAFTVGNDIYFNEGKYNPSTTSGKHLLAHELTHTIQQKGVNNQGLQSKLIQRTEEEDIAAGRASYAQMVRDAIAQINNELLASNTFSDTLGPFFQQLARDNAIVWRSGDGSETPGSGGDLQLQGGTPGPSSVHYRLIIAEGMDEHFNGLHSSSNRTITLNRDNLTTVEAIRRTLYHEGIHMLSDILTNRGADAIGGTSDVSVQALYNNLHHREKPNLRRWIEFIRNNVNARRTATGVAEIPESAIDPIVDFLWDEISTRAETYYFELQIWLGEQRRLSDGLPNRNYFSVESLKRYLKLGGFLSQDDIDNLQEEDNLLIDSLQGRLLNNQWYLIKGRGVANVHIPYPGEPEMTIIRPERIRPDLGPINRLEPPSFLDEIIEDARELSDH